MIATGVVAECLVIAGGPEPAALEIVEVSPEGAGDLSQFEVAGVAHRQFEHGVATSIDAAAPGKGGLAELELFALVAQSVVKERFEHVLMIEVRLCPLFANGLRLSCRQIAI